LPSFLPPSFFLQDSRTETIADWNDDRRDDCLSELKVLANKNLMALERTKVIEEGEY